MTAYSDDFNRSDRSLDGNWTILVGAFSIVSNQLSASTTFNEAIYSLDLATDNNGTRFTITASITRALAFARANGSAATAPDLNCYAGGAILSTGFLRVFKIAAGVFTQLGSDVAYTYASGDVVACTAVGSTVTLTLNGAPKIVVTDATVTTGKRGGLRAEASGQTVDSFSTFDVGSPVPENRLVRRNSLLRR